MSSQDWKIVASENFNAANELSGTDFHRSTLSRAYYAAYAKVVSALIQMNISMPSRGNPSHSKMPDLIQVHFRKLSPGRRNSLEFAFSELYRRRVLADYSPDFEVSKGFVRKTLSFLGQVIRDTNEALKP